MFVQVLLNRLEDKGSPETRAEANWPARPDLYSVDSALKLQNKHRFSGLLNADMLKPAERMDNNPCSLIFFKLFDQCRHSLLSHVYFFEYVG